MRHIPVILAALLPLAVSAQAQQTYPLYCSMGPSMNVQIKPQNRVSFRFIGAPQGSDAARLGLGECAWRDRPLNGDEPTRLTLSGNKARALVDTMFRGGRGELVIFDVHNAGQGHMPVSCINVGDRRICD